MSNLGNICSHQKGEHMFPVQLVQNVRIGLGFAYEFFENGRPSRQDRQSNVSISALTRYAFMLCVIYSKLPGHAMTESQILSWLSQHLSKNSLILGAREELLLLCRVLYVEPTGQNTLNSASMRSWDNTLNKLYLTSAYFLFITEDIDVLLYCLSILLVQTSDVLYIAVGNVPENILNSLPGLRWKGRKTSSAKNCDYDMTIKHLE